MRKLHLCTSNPAKIVRYNRFFADHEQVTLVVPTLNAPPPDETGSDVVENAHEKALYYSQHIDGDVLCIDEALYFDHLDEKSNPSIHVRRHAGKYLDDMQLHEYIAELAGKEDFIVRGYYEYGYVIVCENGDTLTARDKWRFYIDLRGRGVVHEGYPTTSIMCDEITGARCSELTDDQLLKLDVRDLKDFQRMVCEYQRIV